MAELTNPVTKSTIYVPDGLIKHDIQIVSMSDGKHIWFRETVRNHLGHVSRYEWRYIDQDKILRLA